MSNKEIRLKWLSDDSEIDKSIQRLQQKLTQMNRSSAQMTNIQETGGTLSPNALKAKGTFESSQRAILERERREVDVQQRKEVAFLTQKERHLKRLQSLEGDLSKKQKERLKALELEVNMSSKKIMDQEITKNQIDTNLNQGKIDQGKGTSGGIDGIGGTGIKGLLQQIGIGAMVRKVFSGIESAVSAVYGDPSRMSRQNASLVQGGAEVSGFNKLYSGKGIENSFFKTQRMKAMSIAQSEVERGKMTQIASVAGGAALTATGLGVAAAAPATGGISGPIGLTMAGAGSAAMIAGHPRSRAGLRGKFGLGEGTEQKELSKYDAQTFVESFKESLETEKKQDYFGQKSLNYLEGNRGSFLQGQRQMGMNDQGLKGYLTDDSKGLFTQQEKLGSSAAILGAGGSTAQARDANQALALNRDYGISSAQSVLGKISGNVEGGAVSDQAVGRILSEAMAVGLDTSKFAAEMNKYVSITGDFIAASGASSPTEQARIASSMNKFVGGRSMAEISAGKGAKDQMNNMLGSGGGMFRKRLQIGAMMKNPKLSKLDPLEQGFLANMSPDQLRAGGEDVEALSKKAGYESYEDFLGDMLSEKGIKAQGRTLSGNMEDIEERTKSAAEAAGVDVTIGAEDLNKQIKNATSPERKKSLQSFKDARGEGSVARQMMELGGPGNKTKQQRQAFELGSLGFGSEQPSPEGTFGVLSSDLMPAKRERGFGDIGREAQAKGEQALTNKAMSPEILERYKQAGEATISMTDEAVGKWTNFMNSISNGLDDVNTKARELVETLSGGSSTPPSVGEMNQFMKNLTSFGDEGSQPLMTRPPKAGK